MSFSKSAKRSLFGMAASAFSLPMMLFFSSAHAAEASKPGDPQPRLFLTREDVSRFRQQAARPELAAAYADLEAQSKKSVEQWRKKYPASATPRPTAELIETGKRDIPWPDFKTVASAFALHPTSELGEVLREKLLTRIGARQVQNYWRPLGIHEAEAAMQFMEALDLTAGTGILSAEDQQTIQKELRLCAHFLEGWTLDNSFSRGYDYYRTSYCLNFHVFASAMMGIIAMNYPDLAESKEWLRKAQSEIPALLLTEFGIDGGYGEGSLHYWHPTYRALQQFMVVSRNRGLRDYYADPAVADAMRRSLAWRMQLTAPDGRSVAIGDSDRNSLGAEYLLQGGAIQGEPAFVWTARAIMERARHGLIPDEPYELLHFNQATPERQPEALFANFPYSGYGILRSGWGANDNYLLLKYGTTFIGRRENETNLVISGHAHADALELELHYKGIPITVDPGRVGRYQDWGTYGGYCKATVAHNTVGIGNRWGYDRLDGKYDEHVKKHGSEFLYETSQKDIGRSDMELKAFGDTGQISIISARLKTYADITHQRTVVWFRDTGVAVVGDQLESPNEQPYEWYLNPVGKLIKQDKTLTFGDDAAKLDVVPLLPRDARVQITSKGDPKVPPYYVPLRPDNERRGRNSNKPYVVEDRWGQFTLLTLQAKAKNADFLNVLIPYEKQAPLVSTPMGKKGARFTNPSSTLLVAGAENNDSALTVDGNLGVARLDKGKLTSYALHHGHGLKMEDQQLVGVKLLSEAWAPFYDSAVTAAVSLADRRASFNLPINPMDRGLVMYSPKIKPGEEPALPIQVAVTFRVDEKPKRIIALRSETEMPKLNDPEFDRKTTGWQPDPHVLNYLRQTVDFIWDEKNKTVTLTLDSRIRQMVWE